MADSASESYVQSDSVGLRHISSSFFNIPGFFLGFSSRGSPDAESLRSPTSPLDFSFFSNISNPFSQKSPRSPCRSSHQKTWDCSKVGLGIVNLLAGEIKPSNEVIDSPRRNNIIFGPQVKTDNSVTSNSLPRNYTVSLLSQTENPHLPLGKFDTVLGIKGVALEPKSLENPSIDLTQKPNLSSKATFSENIYNNTVASSPLVIDRGSRMDNSLDIKLSSLSIPIGSSRGYVGSLSAREIELSEDYTCIISHGPNPKTTHIFGDYVLECHANEFVPHVELPHETMCPEGSTPIPCCSDDFLSFCYSCKKKLEKGDDNYIYRGEKAFCSLDCSSREMFAEEEKEKISDNSSESSLEPSYDEDLFLLGMLITM